jgi:putative FmdB family regulatory protein
MPFYEYRCGACGHEFEAMQKMSDAPLTDCPSCSEGELVKLVSAAGFQLKGSGWYKTDFKGDSKSSGSKSENSSAGGHSCSTGSCPACN